MSIEQRIRVCRLLEKMEGQEAYSKKIGMENTSIFHGRRIDCGIESVKKKG